MENRRRIVEIELKNANFFQDGFKLTFNEKLNCIMGGRGTGKSTLLYFLMASLFQGVEDDRQIYNLLSNNLGGGEIIVEFCTDFGDTYKLKKILHDDPQAYIQPTDEFVPFDRIKKHVKCDFYPAQKIEEIGRKPLERLDLIDRMVEEKVNEQLEKIEALQIELDKGTQELRSINAKIRQKKGRLSEFENLEEDLTQHEERIPESISEGEKAEFDLADKNEKLRFGEKRYLSSIEDFLQNSIEKTSRQYSEVEKFLTEKLKTDSQFSNQSFFEELLSHTQHTIEEISNSIKKAEEDFVALKEYISGKQAMLEDEHSIKHAEFVELKKKFSENKEYFDRLNLLTKKIDLRNALVTEVSDLQEVHNGVKKNRDKVVDRLNEVKQELFNNRLGAVRELNSLFDGKVRIQLNEGGITEEFENQLRAGLKGSGLHYNALIPRIVENFRPDQFARIVHARDSERLRTVSGIDAARSVAVIDALFETDSIYHIEKVYCPDLPEFLLKVESGQQGLVDDYKRSEELSTGQRCTTVLPIVFAVSRNPLIIDQPEDNLDNKYISDSIHKIIREQKEVRQLIFITHNPNIPVLAESENNSFLTYDKVSSIDSHGTVDDVKESILSLLEGGNEAFDKRKELYGR